MCQLIPLAPYPHTRTKQFKTQYAPDTYFQKAAIRQFQKGSSKTGAKTTMMARVKAEIHFCWFLKIEQKQFFTQLNYYY